MDKKKILSVNKKEDNYYHVYFSMVDKNEVETDFETIATFLDGKDAIRYGEKISRRTGMVCFLPKNIICGTSLEEDQKIVDNILSDEK